MSENLWVMSSIMLFVTGILCVVGVLAEAYNDTFWQRLALGLIAFGCFGHVTTLIHYQFVPWDRFLLHLGMFIYAVATAIKCYGFRLRDKIKSYEQRKGIPT
jgi:uncharacterized membrane protein YidH (DUF202 family)